MTNFLSNLKFWDRAAIGKAEDNILIPFTKEAVRDFLDGCIRSWSDNEIEARTLEDVLIARSHIDALQSVRISIFGKELD